MLRSRVHLLNYFNQKIRKWKQLRPGGYYTHVPLLFDFIVFGLSHVNRRLGVYTKKTYLCATASIWGLPHAVGYVDHHNIDSACFSLQVAVCVSFECSRCCQGKGETTETEWPEGGRVCIKEPSQTLSHWPDPCQSGGNQRWNPASLWC